jgi:hypothetical protein
MRLSSSVALIVFLQASLATAGPAFHCYSMPNSGAQAFEYTNGGCGGEDVTKKLTPPTKDDVRKDILCLWNAGCEPITQDKAGTPPPKLSTLGYFAAMEAGAIKPSILICRGKANLKDGLFTKIQCPPPTECQSEVTYNMARIPPMAPTEPEGLTIPGTSSESELSK